VRPESAADAIRQLNTAINFWSHDPAIPENKTWVRTAWRAATKALGAEETYAAVRARQGWLLADAARRLARTN